MLKNPIFVKNGFFSMIWLLILIAFLVALAVRIVACIRKSSQSGKDWDFSDKYAANRFGE